MKTAEEVIRQPKYKSLKDLVLICEAMDEFKSQPSGIERLEPFKDHYDFNCQLFNGEYNVYVERDIIDLYSVGGYNKLDDAIDEIIKWIKRVNRIS